MHVIETLGRGGAERLLVTLLPELMRQGCLAEVAVQRGSLDLKPDLDAAGIPVHVLPAGHKWSLFKGARNLATLAKSRDCDVVHAHLFFPTIITALARYLRLFPGVTFASFHNLAYGGANAQNWKLKFHQKLGRVLVKRGIDHPQGVSQATADHYKAAYGLSDVAVMHNAIDLSKCDGIEPSPNNAIVLPGRLVQEKGHSDLIAALSSLETPCPPVIFAGDGPLRSQLEKAISEAGLPITITGPLSHHDMLLTIASGHLIVIPSRYEGFGLTALEAMALGRPIVATTVGGLTEVLGELGSKIPPNDPPALTKAISRALADHEWRATQSAAGPSKAATFAAPTIAAKQIALYQQIKTTKGPRP